MSNENYLLKGNLFKGILLFSLPLMLTNFIQVLFNMSDIAVIGKFDGEIALGAVGSTSTLVTLFTSFIIGISNGVNVVVAKYIGSDDKEKLEKSIHTSFIILFLIGIVLMIIGMSLARPLLMLLNTKDAFIDLAQRYLTIYFIGLPGCAIYNYGNAIYSAKGKTTIPLIFLFLSGCINVGLNLILVIYAHLSVAGVAIASFISFYISAFLMLLFLSLRKDNIKLDFKKLRFDKEISKEILKLGLVSGIQNAIFAIANSFILLGVNSLDDVMVEGNSASMNADNIIYEIMAAVYVAGATFISQNYGAKNFKRIKESYLISLLYSFVIALILGLFILLFSRQFLSIFTNEEAVIEAGQERLKIMCFCYCFSAIMDTATAASRGLGKTLVPTIIIFLGSCVFRIIWIYTIFAHYKTFTSLYLLYIFSWVLSGIAETIYFIYLYNKRKKECELTETKILENN